MEMGMKFSWKIFFTTLWISLVILSAGGVVLMQALFQGTYEREQISARKENQMLQYSFVAYWNTVVGNTELTQEHVEQVSGAMVEAMSGNAKIRISAEDGTILFENLDEDVDAAYVKETQEGQRSQILKKTLSGYALYTVSVIRIEEGLLYLESSRDVTAIFQERAAQYAIYRKWMFGLLAAEGICSFLMALWLLRPLRKLSRVTRRIAKGDLGVRARMESKDEFGDLARDFNHMADSLEEQFRALQEAARRQEDFIGSFAHELKTPLTSMIGYADMLRSQAVPLEEQFQAANYIFKEGRRLEALSLKLLELMVLRNEELEVRQVSAKWLAEDVKGLFLPVLNKSRITLRVVVEEHLVHVEPDLMKTVLQNLLDNGRKAMEDREGPLYLLGRKEEQGFAFYVRDMGRGIPPEEVDRITEAFYMVDKSRARRQGGAGLGLSICCEIIKRHGGTITFKSEEGKGTVVRIYLPEEKAV